MSYDRKNGEYKQKLCELYNSGKYTCTELADIFDKSISAICFMLHRLGIKVNKCPKKNALKYSLNENYFNTVDTEDKAYFLGLFYADGYNRRKDGYCGIQLQSDDSYILEKFRDVT